MPLDTPTLPSKHFHTWYDKIISNRPLLAVARIAMALMMPVIAAGVGYVGAQAKSLNDTVEKVTVLETQIGPLIAIPSRVQTLEVQSRERERFEALTARKLDDIQTTQTAILSAVAGVISRLDEQDRVADRAAKKGN